MQSMQLDMELKMERNISLLEIHGELIGVNKDTSEWQLILMDKELVVCSLDHQLDQQLIEIYDDII